MKVVTTLSQSGFLRSQRGRSGGFTLARPPEDMRLGDVIRATEPDYRMVECMSPDNACTIVGGCRLPGIVSSALRAFMDVMDRHTLADLAIEPDIFLPREARPNDTLTEGNRP